PTHPFTFDNLTMPISCHSIQLPPSPTLFPYTTLFRSQIGHDIVTSDGTTLLGADNKAGVAEIMDAAYFLINNPQIRHGAIKKYADRNSTRLNSSHLGISYAVFCLKKKT